MMMGGALGSLMRYLATFIPSFTPFSATLFVNGLGSFIIGFLYIYLAQKDILTTNFISLVMIGALGGFTTFSTFSLEIYKLLEESAYLDILKGVTFTLLLTLGGVCLGAYLGKLLTKGF